MPRFVTLIVLMVVAGAVRAQSADAFREIPAEVLEDKVRGGLLGQLLGNLNGLPHEFKYIDEPGRVETYVPGLPDGAGTDDDTDIEWVYVTAMHRGGELLSAGEGNRRAVEAAHQPLDLVRNVYARRLMDLGLEPPLTGRVALNPWAEFNISGSFLSETFGLVAPRHAAVGREDGAALHARRGRRRAVAVVAVRDRDGGVGLLRGRRGEGARRGRRCDRPESRAGGVDRRRAGVARGAPGDWKTARRLMRDKYTRHGGTMRDRNGYD